MSNQQQYPQNPKQLYDQWSQANPPKPPVAVVNLPQTAWQSAPAAVRFAVWVWAISVIAGLAGAAVLLVLFAIGINAAILGGN